MVVEKILEEDSDSEDTAKERFEKSVLPIIRTVHRRERHHEEGAKYRKGYEDKYTEETCRQKALQAGTLKRKKLVHDCRRQSALSLNMERVLTERLVFYNGFQIETSNNRVITKEI